MYGKSLNGAQRVVGPQNKLHVSPSYCVGKCRSGRHQNEGDLERSGVMQEECVKA